MTPHPAPSVAELAEGIAAGTRSALARAITRVESRRPDHRREAEELVQRILPRSGGAIRVGITGVPGVGKSTTIDTLGMQLLERGHRVAVLAVDPSSSRTGGSILGDKTRMARLAADPRAFVRPSPSAGTLGGVAARTRETLLLCEAAGFDVVLVETVGVGQSETAVAEMTDTFLVLMLPGAGDELQGIKKGILELADIVAVNKADGGTLDRARAAAAEYAAAMHVLGADGPDGAVPVLTCSGLTGAGLDAVWEAVEAHRRRGLASGAFTQRRRRQQVRWMWALLDERLRAHLASNPRLRAEVPALENAVGEGSMTPSAAAERLATLLRLCPY